MKILLINLTFAIFSVKKLNFINLSYKQLMIKSFDLSKSIAVSRLLC